MLTVSSPRRREEGTGSPVPTPPRASSHPRPKSTRSATGSSRRPLSDVNGRSPPKGAVDFVAGVSQKNKETCSFRCCAASGSFPIKVKIVVPQRDAGSVDTNFLLQEEWVIRSRDTSGD